MGCRSKTRDPTKEQGYTYKLKKQGLPVSTDELETTTLATKAANKLRTTQRSTEGLLLGVNLRDRIRNEEIWRRTEVEER